MGQTVTLIAGDGITQELVDPVRAVLDAANAGLSFDTQDAGESCYECTGDILPPATLESIRSHRVALKGKLLSRRGGPYCMPNLVLRKELDLYATVLPIQNLDGLQSRHTGVDFVIIRQATEDVYSGLEHTIRDGMVASLKVVTAAASERITRFAFEYAKERGRKKVTLVHKANIMKVTDGLFIDVAKEVAADFPEIEFGTMIVDNACMQLLMRPEQFDVVLMGNLYGGIMSDLGAGIVGGISASMGASFGEDVSVFEALHGDAPHLAGKGMANPLPLLMPACFMLEHLGMEQVAARIKRATSDVLRRGITTADLGGQATTAQMTEAMIAAL